LVLCAPRWQEALKAGQAPRVVLRATHEGALGDCSLDFPKELFAGNFEAAEVMLVIRIVVRVEARETLNME
jgi:Uncharacterized protein conserved in bacteria (DUF2237)